MKKIFFFLLFWSLTGWGIETPQKVALVSPKLIKHHESHKFFSLYDSTSKKTSPIPKIHQGIWPYFCPKHLCEDPAGCSAWSEDENGQLELDFILDGSSEAYFDKTLIQRIANQIHLIPKSKSHFCDWAWCPTCKQTVLRGVSYEDEYEDDENNFHDHYVLVYKCGCTGKWWLDLDYLRGKEIEIFGKWQFCNAPAIYPTYFDWHHSAYFRFLGKHLSYIEENPSCNCYWPQMNQEAKALCDKIYERLLNELENSNLDKIRETFRPPLTNRSKHGFLCGLFTHAFLYSDYHTILSDFDQHCFVELSNDYPSIHDRLLQIEEEIQSPFLSLYSQCLQKHPHPKVFYERGMVLFHRGENLDSLNDIQNFISYAKNNRYQNLLSSDLYLTEGRMLSESLSYDEAIVSLTVAIEKDPGNKEAYFERAIAYFEKGDFEKSLSDYITAGIHPKKVDPKKVALCYSYEFGEGIRSGIKKGGEDPVVEFVPSILSSLRGISRGLWAFVSSPIDVSLEMTDCVFSLFEYVRNSTKEELIGNLVPELQEYIKEWKNLDDFKKGHIAGHIIGKYGIEIFATSGTLKTIQLYRNLRKANAVMTLETATISPEMAREVLIQSAKEEKARAALLKNGQLKIQRDKQGKHIEGHRNYIPEKNKGILVHDNPQGLLEEHAGTGKKYGNRLLGEPGYKEDVDFKEFIGYAVDENTGVRTPTSWGRIHYAKDGAHIVPIKPRR